MNPKITKLREEHEKLKARISRLSARERELDKQIREMENTDIIGLVRSRGLSVEEFAELMRSLNDAEPDPVEQEAEDEVW